MDKPRQNKFTHNQLRKQKCTRCEQTAEYQWSACADDNAWRPLCPKCDYDLNVMVIRWYGFPDAEKKLKKYAKLLKVKYQAPPTTGE